MSDLISRKAAIEKIESHTRVGDELYPLTDTDKILNHAFEIAASCVYNLPSAQPEDIQKIQDLEQAQLDKIHELAYQDGKADAMRWIPCSERLPENGGRYLISVLDGINRRTTVAPYLPRCKAWAMNGRMAYWKVIAWLPLPEPYREEEQDG